MWKTLFAATAKEKARHHQEHLADVAEKAVEAAADAKIVSDRLHRRMEAAKRARRLTDGEIDSTPLLGGPETGTGVGVGEHGGNFEAIADANANDNANDDADTGANVKAGTGLGRVSSADWDAGRMSSYEKFAAADAAVAAAAATRAAGKKGVGSGRRTALNHGAGTEALLGGAPGVVVSERLSRGQLKLKRRASMMEAQRLIDDAKEGRRREKTDAVEAQMQQSREARGDYVDGDGDGVGDGEGEGEGEGAGGAFANKADGAAPMRRMSIAQVGAGFAQVAMVARRTSTMVKREVGNLKPVRAIAAGQRDMAAIFKGAVEMVKAKNERLAELEEAVEGSESLFARQKLLQQLKQTNALKKVGLMASVNKITKGKMADASMALKNKVEEQMAKAKAKLEEEMAKRAIAKAKANGTYEEDEEEEAKAKASKQMAGYKPLKKKKKKVSGPPAKKHTAASARGGEQKKVESTVEQTTSKLGGVMVQEDAVEAKFMARHQLKVQEQEKKRMRELKDDAAALDKNATTLHVSMVELKKASAARALLSPLELRKVSHLTLEQYAKQLGSEQRAQAVQARKAQAQAERENMGKSKKKKKEKKKKMSYLERSAEIERLSLLPAVTAASSAVIPDALLALAPAWGSSGADAASRVPSLAPSGRSPQQQMQMDMFNKLPDVVRREGDATRAKGDDASRRFTAGNAFAPYVPPAGDGRRGHLAERHGLSADEAEAGGDGTGGCGGGDGDESGEMKGTGEMKRNGDGNSGRGLGAVPEGKEQGGKEHGPPPMLSGGADAGEARGAGDREGGELRQLLRPRAISVSQGSDLVTRSDFKAGAMDKLKVAAKAGTKEAMSLFNVPKWKEAMFVFPAERPPPAGKWYQSVKNVFVSGASLLSLGGKLGKVRYLRMKRFAASINVPMWRIKKVFKERFGSNLEINITHYATHNLGLTKAPLNFAIQVFKEAPNKSEIRYAGHKNSSFPQGNRILCDFDALAITALAVCSFDFVRLTMFVVFSVFLPWAKGDKYSGWHTPESGTPNTPMSPQLGGSGGRGGSKPWDPHYGEEYRRVSALFRFLHGDDTFANELDGILETVGLLGATSYGFAHLMKFCLFYPVFMYPALRLQKQLRRKFFGERYWEQYGREATTKITRSRALVSIYRLCATVDAIPGTETEAWAVSARNFLNIAATRSIKAMAEAQQQAANDNDDDENGETKRDVGGGSGGDFFQRGGTLSARSAVSGTLSAGRARSPSPPPSLGRGGGGNSGAAGPRGSPILFQPLSPSPFNPARSAHGDGSVAGSALSGLASLKAPTASGSVRSMGSSRRQIAWDPDEPTPVRRHEGLVGTRGGGGGAGVRGGVDGVVATIVRTVQDGRRQSVTAEMSAESRPKTVRATPVTVCNLCGVTNTLPDPATRTATRRTGTFMDTASYAHTSDDETHDSTYDMSDTSDGGSSGRRSPSTGRHSKRTSRKGPHNASTLAPSSPGNTSMDTSELWNQAVLGKAASSKRKGKGSRGGRASFRSDGSDSSEGESGMTTSDDGSSHSMSEKRNRRRARRAKKGLKRRRRHANVVGVLTAGLCPDCRNCAIRYIAQRRGYRYAYLVEERARMLTASQKEPKRSNDWIMYPSRFFRTAFYYNGITGIATWKRPPFAKVTRDPTMSLLDRLKRKRRGRGGASSDGGSAISGMSGSETGYSSDGSGSEHGSSRTGGSSKTGGSSRLPRLGGSSHGGGMSSKQSSTGSASTAVS